MPVTVTRSAFSPSGAPRPIRGGFGQDVVMTIGQIGFTGTYTAGGELLTPRDVGLSDIMFIMFTVNPGTNTTIAQAVYNPTTSRLMVFTATATGTPTVLAEMSGGTSLTAWTMRYVAFGRRLS